MSRVLRISGANNVEYSFVVEHIQHWHVVRSYSGGTHTSVFLAGREKAVDLQGDHSSEIEKAVGGEA